MLIKLLSGDLITLETQSLDEARQQLSDRLLQPRRHLKLIDPETGEPATSPKELLYLFCENAPSGDTTPMEVWWEWQFDGGVDELFEQIGSTFRPKHSPEEFEEIVRDRSYRFTEYSPRSRMTVFRSLLGFMVCRVSPVFLIDYLPRLQPHHYHEEKNVVRKLLRSSHMNMLKIEHYSEEDADELLFYLCKLILPRFDLHICFDTLYSTIELNMPRTLSYLLEREASSEEVCAKLLKEFEYRVKMGKCSNKIRDRIEKYLLSIKDDATTVDRDHSRAATP